MNKFSFFFIVIIKVASRHVSKRKTKFNFLSFMYVRVHLQIYFGYSFPSNHCLRRRPDDDEMMIVGSSTCTQQCFQLYQDRLSTLLFPKTDDRIYRGENNGKERWSIRHLRESTPGLPHRSPVCYPLSQSFPFLSIPEPLSL